MRRCGSQQSSSESRDRSPKMLDESFPARHALADRVSNLKLHGIQPVGVGAAIGLSGEAAEYWPVLMIDHTVEVVPYPGFRESELRPASA